MHKNPESAIESGLKLFPNLDPAVVRASVQRLIDDGVFAESVAVPQRSLTDALQTQIDLGNLERIPQDPRWLDRSEEHTSELQSLMRISYAVFCLKKKKQ